MKKILLFALVAIVAVSASAIDRVKKAPLPREQKMAMTSRSNFGGIVKQQATYQVPEFKAVANVQAAKRADEAPELIPAYSEWTYFYTPNAGGMIPQIMYDGASFLVDGEKAYFKPFSSLSTVLEGKVEKGAANKYSQYEADSITFDCSKVFATVTDSLGNTTELYLLPSDWVNYTPVRGEATTFGAYYFAEDQELYIPSSVKLALYSADGTDIYEGTDFYVVCNLDLLPQTTFKQYMCKGKFEAKSYYGSQYDYSGDCVIYFGSDSYCIKGFDSANEDAWVMFEIDENDETMCSVFENQYLATYSFYTDKTHTATYRGDIVTVGLLQKDGSLTAFNSAGDYASTYKVTENADETTTIANADNTVYGDYIYGEEDSQSGMYEAIDLNVNITYEELEDGISSVKNNTKQSNAIYNMAGQRVGKNYKGLVIKNGKKVILK